MTRIIEVDMLRIGVHRAYLLPNVISRIGEVDAVAQRLRHLLLTISTWQATSRQVLWQQNIRLYQYWGINLIKATSQFTSYLEHGFLILTCRNSSCLKQGDVCSLRNRIAEESQGDALALKATHLYFGLHRRITLYTTYRYKVHQICRKFGKFRDLTLDKEHALLGIEACCQIIESHFYNILADLLRIVSIVCERLDISHKHEHTVIIARILQLNTTAQ